jgi:hypothetical protein
LGVSWEIRNTHSCQPLLQPFGCHYRFELKASYRVNR